MLQPHKTPNTTNKQIASSQAQKNVIKRKGGEGGEKKIVLLICQAKKVTAVSCPKDCAFLLEKLEEGGSIVWE